MKEPSKHESLLFKSFLLYDFDYLNVEGNYSYVYGRMQHDDYLTRISSFKPLHPLDQQEFISIGKLCLNEFGRLKIEKLYDIRKTPSLTGEVENKVNDSVPKNVLVAFDIEQPVYPSNGFLSDFENGDTRAEQSASKIKYINRQVHESSGNIYMYQLAPNIPIFVFDYKNNGIPSSGITVTKKGVVKVPINTDSVYKVSTIQKILNGISYFQTDNFVFYTPEPTQDDSIKKSLKLFGQKGFELQWEAATKFQRRRIYLEKKNVSLFYNHYKRTTETPKTFIEHFTNKYSKLSGASVKDSLKILESSITLTDDLWTYNHDNQQWTSMVNEEEIRSVKKYLNLQSWDLIFHNSTHITVGETIYFITSFKRNGSHSKVFDTSIIEYVLESNRLIVLSNTKTPDGKFKDFHANNGFQPLFDETNNSLIIFSNDIEHVLVVDVTSLLHVRIELKRFMEPEEFKILQDKKGVTRPMFFNNYQVLIFMPCYGPRTMWDKRNSPEEAIETVPSLNWDSVRSKVLDFHLEKV